MRIRAIFLWGHRSNCETHDTLIASEWSYHYVGLHICQWDLSFARIVPL